jgi:hypothetical protein
VARHGAREPMAVARGVCRGGAGIMHGSRDAGGDGGICSAPVGGARLGDARGGGAEPRASRVGG